MSTKYSLDINIDPETYENLSARKYRLLAFKAVSTTGGGGMPTVWLLMENFNTSNTIEWSVDIHAYAGVINDELAPGVKIRNVNSVPIDYKQTLNIENTSGYGHIKYEGDPKWMCVFNENTERPSGDSKLICGLSSYNDRLKKFVPFCAFPIEPKETYSFKPIEKIFLTFATDELSTGSVCYKISSQGAIIDMTNKRERSINFTMNQWERSDGVEIVDSNVDFTSKIIMKPSNLMLMAETREEPMLEEKFGKYGEKKERLPERVEKDKEKSQAKDMQIPQF